MLAQLRKFHSSTATKVLYAVLALSFVGWGVGTVGLSRMSALDVVAEVHGERITRRQLDDQTAALQRRFQDLVRGAALPPTIDFRSQALERLIDDALLRHEADRLDLDVTEDEVIRTITTMPELQQDGRFDRELLARVLEAQRDRGEFEAQVRQDLVNQRVRGLVLDGVQVSDAEVGQRYHLDRDTIDLRFARVAAGDPSDEAAVGDADLQRWLDEHADKYRSRPRVRVRYVAYTAADFADLAKPSAEQVQAYYDDHVGDRFTVEEQVHARHVLVKTDPGAGDAGKAEARKKAEALLARAKGGADFAELAKKSSDDPGSAAQGGDLGFFGRGRMVPEFEAAAFALEPGQLSEVVESQFGFHVIRVEEKRPGGVRPLDEVRDDIVKTLAEERGLDLARKQAETDRRAVVGGKPLAEAAGKRPVRETEPFEQGGLVPGIGLAKSFSDTAFALGVGQPSDLVETDRGIYLLEPIERLEPAVPALAEVRARVEADVKRARAETAARERAERLLARAKEVGLEKAAGEAGVKLDTTGPFERRTGTVPQLGGGNAELRADAFTLTPESPLAPRVYVIGSDAVVVALAGKDPADPAGLEEAKAEIRQTLVRERQQLALEEFMTFLKERAQREGALEVNTDAIG